MKLLEEMQIRKENQGKSSQSNEEEIGIKLLKEIRMIDSFNNKKR